MRLSGKIALITGACAGIGRACAEAFLEAGAAVALLDINKEEGEKISALLRTSQAQAAFFPADVADQPSVEAAVQQTVDRWGRIDILISNAGISGRRFGDGPTHSCTLEAWEKVLAVNLTGTFLVCKAVLPHMLSRGSGSIITMASVLGMVGTQGLFDTHAYATSKAGIIGLTRAMAAQYARDGIRVNAIAPGLIDTPLAARAKSDSALLEKVAVWQPLGALGSAHDVATAAVFLGSDESRFITGVILPVDGGWTVQ